MSHKTNLNEEVVGSEPLVHPRWRRVSKSTFKHSIEWRLIPGFLDYEVSEFGDVRHGAKYLKPERTVGNDRKRFSLTRNKQVFRFKAAQLVAMAFIGPQPFPGAEVCHDDGFKHNNHYSNLRWDTHQGNADDDAKLRAQIKSRRLLPQRQSDRLKDAASIFLAARR